MRTLKQYLATLLTLAAILFCTGPLMAQIPTTGDPQTIKTDYSDEAITKYVEVMEEVLPIQQKAEKNAIEIIEANDLTLDRFNQILAVQQNQSDAEVSSEELASFNTAAQEIMKKNASVQEQVLQILKNEGLSPEKYRNMLVAYERDEEFQKKVDAFVLEETN
ncbi:hypothetical protein C9994_07015 [Marivirga lumbricoides]|uniref:DUF4168 domain-containing protein n=1 Tax=Marivirga lumbricoides TaxID=1046115 RepID=A0A2T4DRV6_9BACT|nr:hypothetical protein C9994_07015 [Marivirga lumbricoides]